MTQNADYGGRYRPRLLDLFCGAGGAAKGYQRAGFHVVGVDIDPQLNYCGDEFLQLDALALLDTYLADGEGIPFDVIHASPPCQAYAGLAAKDGRHPRLIEPVRAALERTGKPWVIENIAGAPLRAQIQLCGSMFGLNVRRHRLFESSELLFGPPSCDHACQDEIRAYYGKKGWLVWTPAAANIQKKGRLSPLLRGSVDLAVKDMGIDWMTWDELREAIPPAYTEWIGAQLVSPNDSSGAS
jgi:DNA (cytosine-5)-methyltransferase 1